MMAQQPEIAVGISGCNDFQKQYQKVSGKSVLTYMFDFNSCRQLSLYIFFEISVYNYVFYRRNTHYYNLNLLIYNFSINQNKVLQDFLSPLNNPYHAQYL